MRWKNAYSQTALVAIIVTYLIQCFYINKDLSNARYELFMDEHVSFDGVKKIYESSSETIIKNLRVSRGYGYGGIFWNSLAFFSYPFYKLFGDRGLIISNRMAVAIFQMLSYILLLYFFVPDERIRILGMLVLVSLPGSIYFASMPKPEPIQLLFFTFFLISKFKRYDFLPFFFLGVSLGSKISALPMTLFYLSYSYFNKSYKTISDFLKRIFILSLGIILGEPILSYLNKSAIVQYINTTFPHFSHGRDQDDVNIFSWLAFFAKDPRGIFGIVLIIIFCFFIIKDYKKEKNEKGIIGYIQKPYIFIMISSLSFGLPVIFFVKRIWHHYLHISLVLTTIFMLNFFCNNMKNISKKIKTTSLAIVVLFTFFGIKHFYDKIIILSTRTKTSDYDHKFRLWKKMKTLAIKNTKEKDHICIDPNMFHERTFQERTYVPQWGSLFLKDPKCKLVFLYDHHIKEECPNDNLKKECEEFQERYKQFVNDPEYNASCSHGCYSRIILKKFENVIYLKKEHI